MSRAPALATHPDWDALVDYWLGDTDAAATEAIDAHLLQCDTCGSAFDEVVALAQGVKAAFAHGAVPSMVSTAFVERLKAGGRRVREYHVPRNGSVVCSVAPDDEVLISHMAVPLHGVTRLDAEFTLSFLPGPPERAHDIPFDTAAGAVVMLPKLAEVRQHPSHRMVVRLLAVDGAGERELGHYTFNHQAAR